MDCHHSRSFSSFSRPHSSHDLKNLGIASLSFSPEIYPVETRNPGTDKTKSCRRRFESSCIFVQDIAISHDFRTVETLKTGDKNRGQERVKKSVSFVSD
jgi:hypothetical protein